MTDLLFQEWRPGNRNINFPFSDLAALKNSAGETVDRDLFDDARIYVVGGAVGAYLRRISIKESTVEIAVADPVNGETAEASFDPNSAPDDLALRDSSGRAAGVLVSSSARLAALAGRYAFGDTLFESDETSFVPTVIVPMTGTGVVGFLLDDGTLLTDDVWLVGEDGIVLSIEGGKIRVDVVGDPHSVVRTCADAGVPLPAFCGVRTFNGISPGNRGNFRIFTGANFAADNAIRVSVGPTGDLLFSGAGTGHLEP